MKDEDRTSPESILPRRLPALAVLGLSRAADAEWDRLRAMQYATLAPLAPVRLLAHAVAAALVLFALAGAVPAPALAGWTVLLGLTLWRTAAAERDLIEASRRQIGRREIGRHASAIALSALVWALPLCALTLLAPHGGEGVRAVVWTIMTMLIAATAVGYAAVPLSTLVFGAILGGSAGCAFAFNGDVTAALAACAFAGIVVMAGLQSARLYLGSKMAEAGVAEKSEVVSLLLREFEEGEADWLWQVDPGRRVRSVSPRFAFALGEDPEDVEGRPLIQLIAGESWESGHFHASLHELADKLKRRESFANLLVRVSLRGQPRWWELSASPKTDANGLFAGFRGVGSDVTEQRESAERISYLARYDTLTGLPNRRMLTEALGEAMRTADQWRSRCALLMIDLDRFKAVNDTLGHLVGDKLLARVSARLTALMTDNELCGRLGGDEFAIVVRDATDSDRVHRLADAVIESLSQPYEIDHHTLYVGASIGSAVGPRDGASVETLMRNADLALYQAKDEGRGQHCAYLPVLHAHAEERRQLEFALRHALERNEFSVMYQPVVDAVDEKLVSFEALLRWNSAEHGPISPAKFVPLAEDTRLILTIGEWVLRSACAEAARWPETVKIAVNVSGEQLLDPHFAEQVVSALAQSGLAPHRLEIEVTESIFVRDGTVAQATLERIMALGCGVALDDFGTGYSSLGYLRRLRFSTIKVDRSFVQGAARDNAESLAIVRAVVAMADSLEMSTTAEGVETEEELATVRRLGCRKVQGYLFGRPMPAEDARQLFNRVGARSLAG